MNRMKFPLLRMLVALSAVALLAGCASDQQMGLCTTLGMCNEDPEEVKEKADKKWWCEYYSGKNCGDDDTSSAASGSKGTDDTHGGGSSGGSHDDNGGQ